MKVSVLVGIVATLMLTGCALPIPHQRPLTPIFHGKVSDADTGKPIENVDVWVWGGRSASGRTDGSGNYRVGAFAQATWFVTTFPLPTESWCAGFAVFTHPEYEVQSVAASWPSNSWFDSPCGRVRRDVKLKRSTSAETTYVDRSDAAKAAIAAHDVGLAMADFYTGGLAELGRTDWHPIGAVVIGLPVLTNPQLGESHYDLMRDAAREQGEKEVGTLSEIYTQVPTGDLSATWAVLKTKLDARGAVRSALTPAAAAQLGVPTEWSAMTPEQFIRVMNFILADPRRLTSAITGAGDIGYLDFGQAQAIAGGIQTAAQVLIARQLQLPLPVTYGLPHQYTGDQWLEPGDFVDFQNKEAQLAQARARWFASGGGPLPAWTPKYLGRPVPTTPNYSVYTGWGVGPNVGNPP